MRARIVRSVHARCSHISGRTLKPVCQGATRRTDGLCRQLSVSVSLGREDHHPLSDSAKNSTSTPDTVRSMEQERVAVLEHKRLKEVSNRLLSSDAPISPAICQELRVAFQYWAGHRSRSFHQTDDMEYAEALLDWVLDHGDPHQIETVLGAEDSSPNAGLLNMIESYMVPFRASHRSLQWDEAPLRHQSDVELLRDALVKATAIEDKMKMLHEDSNYTKLRPDHFSCNIVLDLLAKRCWFLKQFGENQDEGFVESGLGGVRTVPECLEAMRTLVDTMQQNDSYPIPNQDAYTLLITAWAHSGLPNAASEGQNLLRLMENDPNMVPTVIPYNAVMFASASSAAHDPSHAASAASLLQHMQENQRGPKAVQPDATTFASVMLAYANAGQPENAQQLIEQMEIDSEASSLRPNTICYNTVLHAWAKSRSPEAATRAEALLKRMKDLYDSGSNPEARPDKVSYSSVISAWAKSPHANAAEHAESILFRLEEVSAQDEQRHIQPDIITYNTVLDAWAKDIGKHSATLHEAAESAAMRAEALLRHMQKQQQRLDEGHVESNSSNTSPSSRFAPITASYNSVLDAWSRSGSADAVHHAQELLDEMKQEYQSGNPYAAPNVVTYNILLGTIARNREYGSVAKAEQLLQRMEDGLEGVKPDVVSYNTVMSAMVKSGETGAAERAEEILHALEHKFNTSNDAIRPNEVTYNIILSGVVRSNDGDCALRAEKILERMIELSERDGRDDLRPSHVSFATVLDAYSKSSEEDAVERADALFRKLEESPNVTLNTVNFNTMINVLSKSNAQGAAQRAESLLDRMQQLQSSRDNNVNPDTVTFSSVIDCWAKSGQEGAAERAEAILDRMEELSREPDSRVKPNAVSYSAVLNAWAKSGSPHAGERAVTLLDRMEEASHGGGNWRSRPNSYCYNATINAIAKSHDVGKADKAHAMLCRMATAYDGGNDQVKPNHISYCTVLNACAYTIGTPEEEARAFHVARSTLLEMMESEFCRPNDAAYYGFVVACRNLLPPGGERDEIVAAVFRECCKTGHVSIPLIRLLQSVVSPHTMRMLLPTMDRHGRLPAEWTRNVKKRKPNRRKH